MEEDKTAEQPNEELEADGYYDDEMEDDELDLSFLDEQDGEDSKSTKDDAEGGTPASPAK